MAIDFPNSPTNGQIFTSGSTSWIYDGVKWGLNTNVAVSNDSMPVGSILWYANTSTVPPGWIAADGSAVSRTTYATLFTVIGTTYGSGDGSTTFNVPSVAATTGKYYIRYTTALGTQTTTSLSTAPVGTMIDWPVTSSYPTGWLRADGSAMSRTSYADLFALIGTTYGTGDGSTTFNLPNMVQAGTGSPVTIIKASLGGTVEPSTVAHASSHIRGGSDIIDADRIQVDFIPTKYTRDSSDSNAGANTDLTAHLKGIDNRFAIAYVTSLPVSPYDGQIIYYQADAANGIVWQLRYNSGSSSSYKWEFVGGGTLTSLIETNEQYVGAAYGALTTAGPLVTVPLAGDYIVTIGFTGNNGQAGQVARMSYDIGATGAVDADSVLYVTSVAAGNWATVTKPKRKNALAASTALVAKYKTAAGSGVYFADRFMQVVPVRVG